MLLIYETEIIIFCLPDFFNEHYSETAGQVVMKFASVIINIMD